MQSLHVTWEIKLLLFKNVDQNSILAVLTYIPLGVITLFFQKYCHNLFHIDSLLREAIFLASQALAIHSFPAFSIFSPGCIVYLFPRMPIDIEIKLKFYGWNLKKKTQPTQTRFSPHQPPPQRNNYLLFAPQLPISEELAVSCSFILWINYSELMNKKGPRDKKSCVMATFNKILFVI